ncbi:MAG: beta-galactosidase [Phycisphaerae bacterium]
MNQQARQEAFRTLRTMNDSPIQQRMRQNAETFVSVVYWKPGDYDRDALVAELRRIRQAGYNSVRFHTARPERLPGGEFDWTRSDDWMDAAAEAGIKVIHHGPEPKVTDDVLAKHGIAADEYAMLWPDEPSFQAALADHITPMIERYRKHPALLAWGAAGEPSPSASSLDHQYDQLRFGRWLEERYGTVEALDVAWNLYPEKGKLIAESFDEAWKVLEGFNADPQISGVHRAKVNYGAGRDMTLYFAEKMNARVAYMADLIRQIDPEHAVIIGTHQLHANQASLRWKFIDWARPSDVFISSIHLAWHFDLVEGEVDRPVFLQARLTNDYFKGGHTSAYETTGGAVQYSGGYPNAMSAGQMRRFMLSYLAAGNESIAFWTWNHRPGGWESGEYGMTSLSGALTEWAEEGGRIARAMERHKHELWSADQETRVGIVEDWDTEAILCFEPERHDLQEGVGQFGKGTSQQSMRARIGAGRAMIDHHVPFQYVTADELREGVGPAYPVLYAPHTRAMSEQTLDALEAYVHAGGRLIADLQFGFQDQWGKVRPTGVGGRMEKLFGAYVDVIHDTRTHPMQVGDIDVQGFFADMVATEARVIARFADGRPAVTERAVGEGSAVLVGFDPGRMCLRPGNVAVESLLAELALAGCQQPWRCTAPMAWRLRSESADHYFLLNDGPARPCFLDVFDADYAAVTDAVTDQPIATGANIALDLPERSGVWLRCQRQ